MAYEKLHSTTIMAAKTALLSNTKKLIITHLSPRYNNKNVIDYIFINKYLVFILFLIFTIVIILFS